MPDSIYTVNLPAGYPAYLGYVDGIYPTMHGYISSDGVHQPALPALFPAAYLIGLTVTGSTLDADGIDVEPGNPSASAGVEWARRKLAAAPDSRPVIYASTLGTPGYGMHDVLAQMAAHIVPRAKVRLLSAHYGAGEHICGPHTCNLIAEPMDGTQYTDQHPGNNGTKIDMSVLLDSFFVAPAPPDPAEDTLKIPGFQGTWLAYMMIGRPDGSTVIVGQGTSGDAYYAIRDKGATDSHAPVKIS